MCRSFIFLRLCVLHLFSSASRHFRFSLVAPYLAVSLSISLALPLSPCPFIPSLSLSSHHLLCLSLSLSHSVSLAILSLSVSMSLSFTPSSPLSPSFHLFLSLSISLSHSPSLSPPLFFLFHFFFQSQLYCQFQYMCKTNRGIENGPPSTLFPSVPLSLRPSDGCDAPECVRAGPHRGPTGAQEEPALGAEPASRHRSGHESALPHR